LISVPFLAYQYVKLRAAVACASMACTANDSGISCGTTFSR
jgi:hypothetical protein